MAATRGVGGVSFARAGDIEQFVAGDSLRGIAAVGVVLAHIVLIDGVLVGPSNGVFLRPGSFANKFINSFDVGVFVFFTLSAYLLGAPFMKSFIRGTQVPRVGKYFRNRALRILPAWIAAWLVTLIVLGPYGTSIGRILAVPAFLQVYVPSPFAFSLVQAWTLDVEVGFYLLLPILGFILAYGWGKRGTPTMRFWVIVAACAVFSAISLKLRMSTAEYDSNGLHQPQALMFAFAPGIILAALSTVAPAWLRARPDTGRMISWAFYAVFWIGLPFYILETTKWSPTRHAAFGAVMGAAIVIAPLVRQWTDGHTSKILDNRWANWIGKRSYSFYLFHLVALRLIFDNIYKNHGEPGRVFVMFAMEMAIMIPVAWVGYQFIERPFILRRAPWRRRPAAGTAGPAPAVATIPADAAASAQQS